MTCSCSPGCRNIVEADLLYGWIDHKGYLRIEKMPSHSFVGQTRPRFLVDRDNWIVGWTAIIDCWNEPEPEVPEPASLWAFAFSNARPWTEREFWAAVDELEKPYRIEEAKWVHESRKAELT